MLELAERSAVLPMATNDRKGSPIRVDADTYRDLKLVARVTGKDIAELARDLLRAPLALLTSKLAPEIAQLKKMDTAQAELAAKARRKVTDE